MGYLFDHLRDTGKTWVDCPEHYPYAMVVDYTLRDKWMYPNPDDAIALAIKDRLPDIEVWQLSVIRPRHLKIRFRSTAERDVGRDALLGVPIEIFITKVTYMNPPDRVDVGEVVP